MAKSQPQFALEFRRQMVELHRAGGKFDELAKRFGVTSWTIRQVKRVDRNGGGDGDLPTQEREKLTGLQRGLLPSVCRSMAAPRPSAEVRRPPRRHSLSQP